VGELAASVEAAFAKDRLLAASMPAANRPTLDTTPSTTCHVCALKRDKGGGRRSWEDGLMGEHQRPPPACMGLPGLLTLIRSRSHPMMTNRVKQELRRRAVLRCDFRASEMRDARSWRKWWFSSGAEPIQLVRP